MTETQLEKIQEYLSGEMASEEQKSFEQDLQTDKALSTAFNTYRTIETHMLNTKKYTSEASLKNSLAVLGNEFFSEKLKTNAGNPKKEEPTSKETSFSRTSTKRGFRLKNLPVWQIAAAVLFGIAIIGTCYILTNKNTAKDQVVIIPATSHDSAGGPQNSIDTGLQNSTSPDLAKQDTGNETKPGIKIPSDEWLVEKYFEPDAAPKDQEGPLEEAFNQYEKGRFTNAAAAFENADLNASTRSEATDIVLTRFYASYYKALSYMATKNDAKAIQLLKDLNGPEPYLWVKVQWYLALAYLGTGKYREVVLLLQAIDKNNGAGKYKVKARKLLTELNERYKEFILYEMQ